jgi:predicted nucleic-acid-binding Zn-ribbon protein
MRNGICPKCGQATVYSGRDIPVKNSSSNMIPIDFKHHVGLDNYVCITCGYIESYISDNNALQRIQENWRDARTSKRKRKR